MKTRILSYLLVAAMLFGMVPFGALTIPASAEAAAQSAETLQTDFPKNEALASGHYKPITLTAPTLSKNNGTAPATATLVDGALRYTMSYQAGETTWSGYSHSIAGDGSNVITVGNYNSGYSTNVGYPKINVLEYDLKIDAMPENTETDWDIGSNDNWFTSGFFHNLQVGQHGYAASVVNIQGLGLCLGVLDNNTDNMRSLIPLGKQVGATVQMRYEFDVNEQILRVWESDTCLGEFNVLATPGWSSGNPNASGVMFGMRHFADALKETESIDVTMSNVVSSAHGYPTHNVSLSSGFGYTLTGEATVAERESYTFNLALINGFKKGANFAVKVNGNVVTSDSDTYTVASVTRPLTITVEGVEALYAKNETLAPGHQKPITLTAPTLSQNNGTAPAEATLVDGALRYTMSYQAGESKWSGYSHNILGDGSNVITVGNYNGGYTTAVGYPKINVLEYTLKIDAMPAWNTTNWDVGLNDNWFTSGFFHNLQVGQHGYAVGITNIEGLGLCLGVLDNTTDNMRSLIPLGKQVGATVQMRYEFDVNEQILRVWDGDTFLGEFNVLATPGWSSGDPNRSGVMFGMRSFTVLTEGQSIDVTMSNLVSSAHAYPATEHTVTLTAGEGYTLTGDAVVAAGGDYTFTLTVADGYQKGANFAVKVNGNVVNSDSDTYTVPAVTENITVTVEGIEEIVYVDVILVSGIGYALAGEATTIKGESYSFTVALANGFKKGANFAVKVNGSVVTSDNDTYTVATVPGDMTITVEGVEALYAKNENLAPGHRKPVTLTAPTLNTNNGSAPAEATLVDGALRYTMSYQAGESKWSGYSHNILGDGSNVITVNNYNSSYSTAVGDPKINVLEYTLKIDAMPAWNTTNWDVGLNSDWFTSGFFHNLQVGQHGYAVGITNIEGLGLCLGVLDNATDNMRSLIPLGKQVGATVQMRYEFDVNEQILRVWESDTFLGEFNVLTTPGWSSGDPNRSGVMFGMRSFTVLTEGQSIDVTMSNLVSSAHAYPATEHTVTLTAGEGYTLTGDAVVAAGGDYTFTLTVADGYQKGANFAVKVNGNVVNSDSDTYTVPAVTENITVTVEGIEAIPHVNITLTAGEGYTLTGEASVVKGQPYTFTFALANGFKKGANFAVKVNGTPVALTDNTYTVASVTEDITVTVEGVVKISHVKNQTYAADHRKAVALAAASLTANNGTAPATYTVTNGAARYTMSYQAGESKWSGYYHILAGSGSNVMSVGNYNGSYATSVGYSKIHVLEYDLKVDAMPVWTTTSWDLGLTNDWFAAGFFFNLQLGTAGYTAAITNIDGLGLCLGVLDNAADNMRSLIPLGKSVGDTVSMRFEFDLAKQVLRAWEGDNYLGEFNVLTVRYAPSNNSAGGVMFGMRSFAVLTETESIDVTMSNVFSAAHAYTAAIGETQYSTLSEAAEAAAGKQTVKLLATTNESVVLDGDLYLDINGINYTAASISGNGTIYGMDSTIDVSSATNVQHTFLPNDLSENVTISRYHEIDGKTYWVRKNGNYYIFHNLVLNTSENVALRPDNAVDGAINPGLSFYYSLQADGRLAAYINASTHGIAISFEDPSGFTKLSDYKAYSSHRTDAVAGGTLFEGAGSLFSGIMSEALPDATNIANAEMTIYARAYIRSTHNDHIPAPGGEFLVFGDVIEISLADLIKAADEDWANLSEDAKAGLQVLYKAFPEEADALGVNEAHFNENAGEGQAPAEGEQVIEFPVATTEIETYNIALKDNIGFTFFVGAMDYEVQYAKVRVQIGTYEPVVFNLSDLTPNAEGKYEIRANVHAAQMTMVIKVEVLLGEEVVHSGAVTVQTYAKAFMELYAGNPEYEKVINVLEDMLHYGTAAQNYFILNTRNPANKDLEDVRNNAIPELVKPTVTNVDGIEYVGATMLFQNRTYVRFYFKVTEGTIADYTFTINGNKVEPVQKGNQYYIESGYIYAHELDIALAVEVNDNAVVTYSPLNYIVNTYNKGENAEGTRLELMQDMYDYYVAAKALNDSLPA